METLEIKERMLKIYEQLEVEPLQLETKGGMKFDRILRHYFPIFVEYGTMKVTALIEYENVLKECNETKNVLLLCSLSASFEWHKTNFWRKAKDFPSLEQVNGQERIEWPWEV